MSDAPVNLGRLRKEKEREAAKRQAEANALKFGRSKAERVLAATRAEKARKMLDAHRLEDGREEE